MAPLGPFGPGRRVAVAASGGADSSALALLAAGWGRVVALIVDHGLRPNSADEAAMTARRLLERGIESRILTVAGLHPGAGLQARARRARYRALTTACAAEGIVDLLVGHHAGDQAETIALRHEGGSGPAGLAGMSALRVAGPVRLLRPLLAVAPARLRATLERAGLPWVEDPSNTDGRFARTRLRQGESLPVTGQAGQRRQEDETAADWPATVAMHPAGFAVLPGGTTDIRALAAAVWTVSGRPYPPSQASVERAVNAGTLHGTRIVPAGGQRFVVREEAATAAPVPACPGAWWDGRFLVERCGAPGLSLGTLGDAAPGWRSSSDLPAAVLRTVPALRRDGKVWAVPHLQPGATGACGAVRIAFRPGQVLAGSPFVLPGSGSGVHLPPGHPMFAHNGGTPGPDVGSGPGRHRTGPRTGIA